MPTPPFSQDRRDWLTEISALFAKGRDLKKGKLTVGLPKACDSVTTISTFGSRDDVASKDQTMGDRPRRLG